MTDNTEAAIRKIHSDFNFFLPTTPPPQLPTKLRPPLKPLNTLDPQVKKLEQHGILSKKYRPPAKMCQTVRLSKEGIN